MIFQKVFLRCSSLTLLVSAPFPLTCVAVDEVPSVAPAAIGSPLQVTEEILQLRQTFGSAWREVGGEAAPQTNSAEEEAIRTAVLDQVRSHPMPSPIAPPQGFCRRAELRESAHQLDMVAHTLECQDLYAEADQLRAVAQRLRVQAREKQPLALLKAGKGWMAVPREATD